MNIPLATKRSSKGKKGKFNPKVNARKPYTITKQREKWTQEEHKRFLEALKLYGRSWRQIEEHMGNRTAVQIRSHAQKFFSKVVRESSQGREGGPIEIPPPRAKRKPTRPYPRKVSVPLKKGAAFHDLSRSNHDNMSPSSTQSLKLFGKTVFVAGSTRPVSTTLPWNSMPTLAPECPRKRSLSGYGDLSYCILQSSGRIEPRHNIAR
ncbi:putative transcription factor MYB-HB-like family [Helianthus anomalus]